MKKKLLTLAMAVSCLAIITAGTLAYFTSEDTAHNVITSGGINIEVVEKTQGEDGILTDFPEEGIRGVMPGSDVSKIVSVKNTGESEAWIRVRVEADVKGIDGADLPLSIEGTGPVLTYAVGSCWILGEDGYYYYTVPVAPGQFTEILFDTVTFAFEIGNEYQGCTANIIIAAQAVQASINGETVMDAKGWPES
ncbi:SipW-dependent-type signal peptide-containing protein [Cuneatibacter caecimuris]|uniref:Putative ribosomally synthesized peptide with SipW-like signal peptide n=1 Tax=Cuneatibacter caecimuris TaxID=1796618 RepID=A0A4Q7P320_9FIRM|nr:SipW-dependent-type signal peptide-containing protein [Cuneatibacter caecimuris]RZS94313.1 putative ribosomally synthesized peptide with SipW-like signal peptide [Cuneatibacter caecimuris]